MAGLSLLTMTLVALLATGARAFFWYGSSSSSSDSSDGSYPSNLCRWGRHRYTPGKPSATALYVDGSGVVGGSQIRFTDGPNCLFSFKLDYGRYFKSSLWSTVGNVVTRYRCTEYKPALFKSSWKDCNFADTTWPVELNVDGSGTCTHKTGSAAALGQLSSKPLFCRAYVRCGPKGSNATTTVATTKATTTAATTTTRTAGPPPPSPTPAPPPTTTTTSVPPPPPPPPTTTTSAPATTTTTTSNQGGVTQTTSSGTTTCPPLKTSCKPTNSCTILDPNFTGRAGLPYTLTISFEGNPAPTVHATVGTLNLDAYISPGTWITTTLSTYQYQIYLPAVDRTVVGDWTVTAMNENDENMPKSIIPPFTLQLTNPVMPILFDTFDQPMSVIPITTFQNGPSTIVGALFQTDVCNNTNVVLAVGTDTSILSSFSSIFLQIKVTDVIAVYTGTLPYTSINSPSYCSTSSATRPVWMALTLKIIDQNTGIYQGAFFIEDYMTNSVDVVNGTPALIMDLTSDNLDVNFVPDHVFLGIGNTGSTPLPNYWYYP